MRFVCLILFVFCFVAGLQPVVAQTNAPLTVSAASSLTEAFPEIGAAFTKAHPAARVAFNFGASGVLKQQIKQGAPVDGFAAAGAQEVDELQAAGLLVAGTRTTFASNRLVLIAPPGSTVKTWDDLLKPSVRRVALPNPDTTPSGRYARETLTKRGLLVGVAPKAVYGETVRQTLNYVLTGDADAAIVFATDARAAGKAVRVVAVATPGTDHAPIEYVAAVVRGSKNDADARTFVAFLRGKAAQALLRKYGFAAATK